MVPACSLVQFQLNRLSVGSLVNFFSSFVFELERFFVNTRHALTGFIRFAIDPSTQRKWAGCKAAEGWCRLNIKRNRQRY